MAREHLFYDEDWHNVVRSREDVLRKRIGQMDVAELNAKESDALAADLEAIYSLVPPTLSEEGITVSQREVDIDISRDPDRLTFGSGPYYVKGTQIDVTVPFTGDPRMFRVKPTTFDYNPPRGEVRGQNVVFSVRGANLTPEKVKSEIDDVFNKIKAYLSYQQKSATQTPGSFRQLAREAIESRKTKLAADTDLISKLGYKTNP